MLKPQSIVEQWRQTNLIQQYATFQWKIGMYLCMSFMFGFDIERMKKDSVYIYYRIYFLAWKYENKRRSNCKEDEEKKNPQNSIESSFLYIVMHRRAQFSLKMYLCLCVAIRRSIGYSFYRGVSKQCFGLTLGNINLF